MKTHAGICLSAVAMVLLAGCSRSSSPSAEASNDFSPAASTSAAVPARSKVYDETADGFEQIAAALKTAKEENKHVLLQFGADWCGWCHLLHNLFKSDNQVAENLAENYVVVAIDVDGQHNGAVDNKYGRPTQYGLPALVILDADGQQLTSKDTVELEEGDHHDPALVLAFLNSWAPK